MLALLALALLPAAAAAHELQRATEIHVDCSSSGSDAADGSRGAPLRSIHAAQRAIRSRRETEQGSAAAAVVHIAGLCELPEPLVLGPADSNVRYVGGAGAILSGGTRVVHGESATGAAGDVQRVDLSAFNFSADSLGELRGRGYSGGSACILLDNYEQSAAELFYRPDGPSSAAGARSYGPAESGTMRIARTPDRAGGTPSAADWAGIDAVDNQTLTINSFGSQMSDWSGEIAAGEKAWLHGLWAWNWADSHRPIERIESTPAGGHTILVGVDDINRDVSPIHPHKPEAQGGYVYACESSSCLPQPSRHVVF